MSELHNKIKTLASQYLEYTVSTRRALHRKPELSYREFETSKYIWKELWETGIKDIKDVAGTGLLAHIEGSKKGDKRIILRAELDALPINELSVSAYKSINNGTMHACGHDAHMAMLLTTAKILYDLRDAFGGDVFFLFQPGEELAPGGASLVMKEGLLQEIDPDAIIAQHVLPELETGKFGFRPGKYMASSDELYIDIRGKGGHAALPGASTDQVLQASRLVVRLKEAVKELVSDRPVVLGFGKLIADGATNVIPETAHIEGTLRTFDETLRKEIHALLVKECKAAGSEDISVKLEIRKGYPVVENNDSLTQRAIAVSENINGENNTVKLEARMSSEDFGYYSQEFPALFYRLGVRLPGEEVRNLHSPGFDLHEPAMEGGVVTMVNIALDLLSY